jgi:hypothetical protein
MIPIFITQPQGNNETNQGIIPELAALIDRIAPNQARANPMEETVQKPEEKLAMSTTDLYYNTKTNSYLTHWYSRCWYS